MIFIISTISLILGLFILVQLEKVLGKLIKKPIEYSEGQGFTLLYILGAVAVWGSIFFYWSTKKQIVNYFNISDYQFSFFLYLFAGVVAVAIFASLFFRYDSAKKIYSKRAVLVYLLISNFIVIALFTIFLLPMISVMGSSDRAGYLFDQIVIFNSAVVAVVYIWYLLVYFCLRFFDIQKVFKYGWIVFIIYFLSVPITLFVSKYYIEYKQKNTLYTVYIDSDKVKQKISVNVLGKYLPHYLLRSYCSLNICNTKNNLNLFLPINSESKNIKYYFTNIYWEKIEDNKNSNFIVSSNSKILCESQSKDIKCFYKEEIRRKDNFRLIVNYVFYVHNPSEIKNKEWQNLLNQIDKENQKFNISRGM